MYLFKIPGVKLPEIYVAERKEDEAKARQKGLPYIIKPTGWNDKKVMAAILWPILQDKFPYIKWERILGIKRETVKRMVVFRPEVDTTVHQDSGAGEPLGNPDKLATSREVEHAGGWKGAKITDDGNQLMEETNVTEDYIVGSDTNSVHENYQASVSLDEFFGSSIDAIDPQVLQEMGMLPEFMDEITDAIKQNLVGMKWLDGWNKKLGWACGEYKTGTDARNLIIMDVSGSIPDGIAYTMCSLIALMKSKANADVIITGEQSDYWELGDELPTPEQLAYKVGGCNEAEQFNHILEDKILGKKWGNVIVFGDMHAPEDDRFRRQHQVNPAKWRNTEVGCLHCYDTRGEMVPGYGRWAKQFAKEIRKNDGSWCRVMRTRGY